MLRHLCPAETFRCHSISVCLSAKIYHPQIFSDIGYIILPETQVPLLQGNPTSNPAFIPYVFDTISNPTCNLCFCPNIGNSRNARRLWRSILLIYLSFPTSGPEYIRIFDCSITPSDISTVRSLPPNAVRKAISSSVNAATSFPVSRSFRKPLIRASSSESPLA